MKQITFISLTCLLLISTFSSYPQNSNTVAKLYDDASLEKLSYSSIQPQNGILGTATPASAVEINNKAVRNFTKDYKKATGVKWMKTSGGNSQPISPMTTYIASYFIIEMGITNVCCVITRKKNYLVKFADW